MKSQSAYETLAVAANVSELAGEVLKSVVGNALADNLNGEPVRKQTVYNLAMAELQKTFSKALEGK